MATIELELPPELAKEIKALHEKMDRIYERLGNESEYLTTAEVAEREGISIDTVRRRVRSGLYQAERVGGKNLRFPRQQFSRAG